MTIETNDLILAGLFFAAALLYASVGHAGASGYLATMALMGVSPALMKPTALTLNVFVAMIATYKFYRVGAFSWRLFLPLALVSVPFAALGGFLTLPTTIYKPIVGLVLIYAAWHSFRSASPSARTDLRPVSQPALLISGAVLGFLSGLTGVGGGIFLSPLLLFFRWADIRTISGTAAAFILVNSIAGLLGVLSSAPTLSPALPLWILATVIAGFIGAEYGSKRLGNTALRKLLALVLVIAGVKMLAT